MPSTLAIAGGYEYTVTDDYTYRDSLVERVEELLNTDRNDEEDYELLKTCEFISELWTSAGVIINYNYAEEYFTNYIEEDISCSLGSGVKELPSYIVIDYEATIKNLTNNYAEIDFEGETYYVSD